jgi:hypothetical protein
MFFSNIFLINENLKEHDLAEGALRVGGIPERVEDLLEGDSLAGVPIGGLPDDAVGACKVENVIYLYIFFNFQLFKSFISIFYFLISLKKQFFYK